jgi:hypothetical protein
LCICVTAGFSVLFVSGALATGTQAEGLFQLDGNALKVLGSTPAMPAANEDADNICAGQRTATGGTSNGTNASGQVCNTPASYPTPLFPSGYGLPTGTASTRFAFVTDGSGNFPSGSSEDIYTGGSKDGSDVSTWSYKLAASSNDKSDIENAFAAFYNSPTTGDKLVYFGGDRTSNSGDENTAFWFLQSPAMESPCSGISGAGCPFTTDGLAAAANGSNFAHHVAAKPGTGVGSDGNNCLVPQGSTTGISFTTGLACTGTSTGDTYGDILVVSAFTSGGAQPNITAYEWIGNGFAKGASTQFCGTSSCTTIKILDSSSAPGCTATENTPACAITDQGITNPVGATPGNTLPTPSPWVYTEKSSDNCTSNSCGASKCTVTANAMCSGIYFEAGLNLTQLGLQSECTSTFVMDTRSSQAVDSSLQDLALGQVGSCGSTTMTTPQDGSGNTLTSEAIGTGGSQTVQDQAAVAITGTQSNTLGGSVSFTLCGPIASTDTSQTCDGTTNVGVSIGSAKAVAGHCTPDNTTGGETCIVTSDTATVTAAGKYCWSAAYSGDTSAGVPGSHDSSAGECFTLTPVTPSLTTCAGSYTGTGTAATCTTASTVTFGSAIHDYTNLNGTANEPGKTNGVVTPINPTTAGGAAQGTITFKLYGPDTSGSTTNCDTLATGFPSAGITVNVSGDGIYGGPNATPPPPSVSFTPQAPGVYHWKAVYSGDPPNTNGISTNDANDTTNGDCGDTNEDVTVQQIPTTITTAPLVYPNDTATITSSGGSTDKFSAGATTKFRLFKATTGSTALQNCQADDGTSTSTGLLYSETATLGTDSHSWNPGTTNYPPTTGNVSVSPTTASSYYWNVTFTPASTDTAHTGSSSSCVENTTVTVTNDNGTG